MFPAEDREEGSALDAIGTVAAAGLKRNAGSGRRISIVAAGLTCVVVAVVAAYLWDYGERLDDRIVVFLPYSSENVLSVRCNALRQLAGFQDAVEDSAQDVQTDNIDVSFVSTFTSTPDRVARSPLDSAAEVRALLESHECDRDAPPINTAPAAEVQGGEGSREPISAAFDRYYDEGVRIFVVTMSSVAQEVIPAFESWVDDELIPANDRPVLLVTVASAPKYAKADAGVYRYYIRSKDEAAILSAAIEARGIERLMVVFVKDSYGETARDLIRDRAVGLEAFEHREVAVSAGAPDVADAVRSLLDRVREQDRSAFLVIGYGSMVSDALLELQDAGYGLDEEALILVVSTFTEEMWRPAPGVLKPAFREKILAVGPGASEFDPDKRGVVFQFSKRTLERAWACQTATEWRSDRSLEHFRECWVGGGDQGEEVEITANGDSRVALRLMDHESW